MRRKSAGGDELWEVNYCIWVAGMALVRRLLEISDKHVGR